MVCNWSFQLCQPSASSNWLNQQRNHRVPVRLGSVSKYVTTNYDIQIDMERETYKSIRVQGTVRDIADKSRRSETPIWSNRSASHRILVAVAQLWSRDLRRRLMEEVLSSPGDPTGCPTKIGYRWAFMGKFDSIFFWCFLPFLVTDMFLQAPPPKRQKDGEELAGERRRNRPWKCTVALQIQPTCSHYTH